MVEWQCDQTTDEQAAQCANECEGQQRIDGTPGKSADIKDDERNRGNQCQHQTHGTDADMGAPKYIAEPVSVVLFDICDSAPTRVQHLDLICTDPDDLLQA